LGLNPYSSPAPTIDQQIQAILSGQYYFISENFYPVNRNGTLGAVPQTLSPSLDNYAPYFQDNWKASSRLTLTLGLRYDYYGAVTDQRGLLYGLADGNLQDILNAPSLTYSLQGSGFYRPGGRNLAPSVGVAFDPSGNGRTAIRASYGISYVNDDFIGSFTETLLSNFPDNNMGGAGPGTLASISLPAPPTGGQVVTSPGLPAVVNDRLRTPYVQQWSLGVQHLMGGYVFDLRYVGNHAARLWRTDELFGQTNELVYLSDPSGSTYNALQFDVSHRLGRHLQFQANYTYSKALTDSNSFDSIAPDPFRDASNYGLDKGPAAFDIRHAFKTNLVYDLPFGRDRFASMPLRPVLGGWSISAIAIVTSGAPFSILAGDGIQTANTISSSALSGIVYYHMTPNGPSMIKSTAIAPDGTGTGLYVPFANPANEVFFDPAAGQPGSLGPRSFYGPGYFNLDLALQKRFRITEGQSLEFRCVAINALNHPVFGFGSQNIDSTGFGLNAAQIGSSRSLQLRLYYRF
jgi:outer membrane receptor protein involved in Fe transport